MTAYKPQDALAHWTVQDMLRQCLTSGRMVEVVYRDSAGQVCIAMMSSGTCSTGPDGTLFCSGGARC